eukprot:NODE_544_length_6231_cov_0.089693.p3 type:complete len:142 gc:universal NODE_544_length_6231_cov_0.089693:4489-4914(+)
MSTLTSDSGTISSSPMRLARFPKSSGCTGSDESMVIVVSLTRLPCSIDTKHTFFFWIGDWDKLITLDPNSTTPFFPLITMFSGINPLIPNNNGLVQSRMISNGKIAIESTLNSQKRFTRPKTFSVLPFTLVMPVNGDLSTK